ncbi:MAG TPA: anti-sigma factor antagonist [Bacteroidales bacterium]|jgi:anti-anti-sigma factor|nr:MAG: putative anti-sigma factor antagonist BtrV [Bacteroidetes bacterium ADurb.Bin416]HBL73399.1 anti-sigma factor antagonist [Bacteroidales bacterium]
MTITSTPYQQGVNVAIDGRIDTANYLEFEQAVNALLNEGVKQLFLDCSQLSYISSSGLRIFLSIQKKMMTSGGSFRIYGMQPGIKEIFDISGFSSIFSIFATKEEAAG